MDTQKNIKLCPKCKTGYDTYISDSTSPVCPYLGSHTGETCGYFIEMKPENLYERGKCDGTAN